MLDYGIYDETGHPIKRPRFCAMTGHMVSSNNKRTHRIKGTQLFYVTDSTIRLSADDIEAINDAILSQVAPDLQETPLLDEDNE